MERRSFVICWMLLVCTIGRAQSFDSAQLDLLFKNLETHNKFMGSIAVSEKGKLIYSKSVGYADVARQIKADATTKYRIGSISKTFTAVLVFKAVEKKKLDLNQTISQFFPAIKNAEKITIKNLLNHRSGIHNFTADPEYEQWNTQAKTEAEMVSVIAKGGSDFEPDSKASYSNSNYVLLTFILEKCFKKPYAALLHEYITKPLHLKDTYLGGPIRTDNHESKSYRMSNGWQAAPETDISIPLGAGGIVASPNDLVRFSDALFGGQLLLHESLEQMMAIESHYGMGLVQIPFDGKVGYGHSGGIDGFSSIFTHFSDGHISYALCSNGTHTNNNDISIAVLSAVYHKPFRIPQFSNADGTDSAALESYLGVYSSRQLPLKITVTRNGTTLIAQATGQAAFSLVATSKDQFQFEPAGIVMEFNPSQKTMILRQGGGTFTFTRE